MSKIADSHLETDKLATFFAETIMRDTVINMLGNEVAEPLMKVGVEQKS